MLTSPLNNFNLLIDHMQPKLFLTLLLYCFVLSIHAQQGYYRTPAIYQNTVIFTAEGDLWISGMDIKPGNRKVVHHAILYAH